MTCLNDRVKEKIEGIEMSIDAEQLVIDGLMKYRDKFNDPEWRMTPEGPERKSVTRRVRQLLDSENAVRNWKQDLSDLNELLDHWENAARLYE